MAASKSRAFTGLVYPDSAPENWQEILRESLGMWLISPLHEPDPVEDFETGAIKTLKPHYHVMYFHGAPVTPKAGRSISRCGLGLSRRTRPSSSKSAACAT